MGLHICKDQFIKPWLFTEVGMWVKIFPRMSAGFFDCQRVCSFFDCQCVCSVSKSDDLKSEWS